MEGLGEFDRSVEGCRSYHGCGPHARDKRGCGSSTRQREHGGFTDETAGHARRSVEHSRQGLPGHCKIALFVATPIESDSDTGDARALNRGSGQSQPHSQGARGQRRHTGSDHGTSDDRGEGSHFLGHCGSHFF